MLGRIDRLNDLIREIDPKGKGIDEEADETTLEDCERAICRVAAAISGLTAKDCEGLANVCMSFQAEQLHKGDEIGRKVWYEKVVRLRRFASLAKEIP